MEAGRTIYVGNIGANVDENSIKTIFETCGPVAQVRIAGLPKASYQRGSVVCDRKPGLNTVYAFVVFADPSQAQTALALDGLQIGDRSIKVSMAKTPPVQQFPNMAAQTTLLNPLSQISSQTPGLSAQLPALNMLPNLVGGATMAQRRVMPQDPERIARTIYIENVAEGVNEQAIADYFSSCGKVVAVRLSGPPAIGMTRKAWMEFDTTAASQLALEYDSTGLHGLMIRVRPSRSAIHTNALGQSDPGNVQQQLLQQQLYQALLAQAAQAAKVNSEGEQKEAVPSSVEEADRKRESERRDDKDREKSRDRDRDRDRHRSSRRHDSPSRRRSRRDSPKRRERSRERSRDRDGKRSSSHHRSRDGKEQRDGKEHKRRERSRDR